VDEIRFGTLNIAPDVSAADITSPGDIAKSGIIEVVKETGTK